MSKIEDKAYTEACREIERLKRNANYFSFTFRWQQEEIDELRGLCARVADALEDWHQSPASCRDLIAELREAAQ